MISSDITGALATVHIQDMRRTADASRTADATRDARSTKVRIRGIAADLRRQTRRRARRVQLGRAHNYVTR